MFYDLNIRRPEKLENLPSVLKTVSEYGYNVVAITTELTEENFTIEGGKKGKKKKSTSEFPLPIDVAQFPEINLKILNRVNITVKEPSSFHRISQFKQLKLYDIISYLPGNVPVLKALTGVSDFDILCYNPLIDYPPLTYTRKLYNQFVQSGIYMELPYVPAILDSTSRKYCIFTAHVYHAVGKSQNIIVTSAGWEPHHFRSTYDIISLCFVYGLNEEKAKHSITRNCEKLLLRARTRRRGKSTVEIIQVGNEAQKTNLEESMEFSS